MPTETKQRKKYKTHTSSEVKKRYNDKTYKQYLLTLRYDTDGELIDQIEKLRQDGKSSSEAIKQLILMDKPNS